MKNIISLFVFLFIPIISLAQPYGYTPRTGSGSSTFTGGTVTSTIVSTDGLGGPACDYSAGTNENLTFCMVGTGGVDFPKLVNTAGTSIDIFGEALRNTDTQICNGVAGTGGEFCINDVMMISNAGNTYLRIWPSSTGTGAIQINYNGAVSNAALNIYDVTGAAALRGSFGYGGSAFSDADYQSRLYIASYGSSQIAFIHDADLGSSTIGWNWLDNAVASAVSIMNLDGDGTLSILNNIDTYGTTGPNTFRGPVVMTGDNANGTGTLRIRPADEDAQLVLCEASNNAAPEVCSILQHQNLSATASTMLFSTNLYLDSTGAIARLNTAFGASYIQSRASSTLGSNTTVLGLYNTSGTLATYSDYSVTGASTGTFTFGTGGTTTVDFRGPIVNGGSATCNGITTGGALCVTDDLSIVKSGALQFIASIDTTTYAGVSILTSAGANAFQFLYGGSTNSDSDYADRGMMLGVSKVLSISRTDDVAAGNVVMDIRDNITATGAVLFSIQGAGEVDTRGYIFNGSSTTCNGISAGALCMNESENIFYSAASTTALRVGSSNGTSNTQIFEYAQGTSTQATTLFAQGTMASNTIMGGVGFYGSTYTDADFADKVTLIGISKMVLLSRTDDVGATTAAFEFMDNTNATGVQFGGWYGDGSIFIQDVSPTALAGTVNDYAGCTKGVCRIDPGGAARIITGIANGADGKILQICNIGTGANTLTLNDEDAGSATAGNRFALDANYVIVAERCVEIIYDSTSSRWRKLD